MVYRFGEVHQWKETLHNHRGGIMKLNPFALLSVLFCLLVAGPPVVSAANDSEVYVVALDNSGNSHYVESLGGVNLQNSSLWGR
jgi:hypothetical protein